MIDKEALQYLVNLGFNKDVLVKTDKGLFSKQDLTRITYPQTETLQVSNLTSIIDFLNANVDDFNGPLLIQILNPETVKVLSKLNEDNVRDEILEATALLPDIYYGRFLDTEAFNIMLQSGFADKGDKVLLLKFTGLIKDERIKETGDDGVSQKATIKTGVATVSEAVVPNPATLAPYRTFPEVEQVESKFIFRMKEGPYAALFEADGGAWRNEAMHRIKEYLEENLKDTKIAFKIIS